MKNLFKLFLLLLVLAVACQEPSDVIYENNATIIWTGEADIDGCGFFIEIDSTKYKPQSESVISNYFKKDERTSVTIQYIDLQYTIDYTCANANELKTIDAIKIISIALNK
jgi:hypothetical protein